MLFEIKKAYSKLATYCCSCFDMTTGEEPGCNLRAPQVESGLIEPCSIEIKFLIRLMLRYIVAMLKFVTHYFSGSDVILELFEAPEGPEGE